MHTKHLARTVAAALLIGGLATGGAALAHADTAAPAERGTAGQSAPTSTQQQTGIVIEASGTHDGHDVLVFLYENAQYGNSLQVVLDPENDVIGWTEQAAPFVVDGQVDVTVTVDGQPARLTGTVAETGTTRVVEPHQDGGEQIVTRGEHTQLDADLVLEYAGSAIDLDAAPAFAFDLDVRSTTLYGR
jgi:hypothetical protein